jgi:hypothetical protein
LTPKEMPSLTDWEGPISDSEIESYESSAEELDNLAFMQLAENFANETRARLRKRILKRPDCRINPPKRKKQWSFLISRERNKRKRHKLLKKKVAKAAAEAEAELEAAEQSEGHAVLLETGHPGSRKTKRSRKAKQKRNKRKRPKLQHSEGHAVLLETGDSCEGYCECAIKPGFNSCVCVVGELGSTKAKRSTKTKQKRKPLAPLINKLTEEADAYDDLNPPPKEESKAEIKAKFKHNWEQKRGRRISLHDRTKRRKAEKVYSRYHYMHVRQDVEKTKVYRKAAIAYLEDPDPATNNKWKSKSIRRFHRRYTISKLDLQKSFGEQHAEKIYKAATKAQPGMSCLSPEGRIRMAAANFSYKTLLKYVKAAKAHQNFFIDENKENDAPNPWTDWTNWDWRVRNGRPPALTPEQEKDVVKFIILANEVGDPPNPFAIRIAAAELKGVKDPIDNKLSRSWFVDFMVRQQEVFDNYFPEMLDPHRYGADSKTLRYEYYHNLIPRLEVSLEGKLGGACYDIDETSIDDTKGTDRKNNVWQGKVVSLKNKHIKVTRSVSRGKHTTFCSQYGNDGHKPAVFIITPEKMSDDATDEILHEVCPGAMIGYSESGSVKRHHMIDWMKHIDKEFKKKQQHLKDTNDPSYIPDEDMAKILSMDMPKIHDSFEMFAWAKANGWEIYLKPPNSTSWSQPCDNSRIHGFFKNTYRSLMTKVMSSLNANRPTTREQIHVIAKVLEMITKEQIQGAFLHCGTLDEMNLVQLLK